MGKTYRRNDDGFKKPKRNNKLNKFDKFDGKNRFSDEFYQLLAKWFECSSSEAEEYCEILIQSEGGLKEMVNICKAYGLTDGEVEKLMGNEE